MQHRTRHKKLKHKSLITKVPPTNLQVSNNSKRNCNFKTTRTQTNTNLK